MDRNGVLSALSALGEHLDYMGGSAVELVICGGSALQVLGLVFRATRDVDVLALAKPGEASERELVPAEPLPYDVSEAARLVARDLGLPTEWLNAGPTQLLDQGLPDGLIDRLHSQSYGQRLTVHFIGRFDQICFKLYAVVNQGEGGRHLADLRALNPSEVEMAEARAWCLTQDDAEYYAQYVDSCLVKIGYADVVEPDQG